MTVHLPPGAGAGPPGPPPVRAGRCPTRRPRRRSRRPHCRLRPCTASGRGRPCTCSPCRPATTAGASAGGRTSGALLSWLRQPAPCLAHHRGGQLVGVVSATRAMVHSLAPAQHGHVVGIGHHLAELVRDHQHGALAAARAVAHMAQHLVGLLRRQHRGGLVQDQQPRLQVQLLEHLELLLLAGRQVLRRGVQVQRKGVVARKACSSARSASSRSRRHLAAGQQQVLGHRHAGHQVKCW
jgi:hypothetical protein